jgi:O-antigen ligase
VIRQPSFRAVPQAHAGVIDFQAGVPGGVSILQGLGFGVLLCFLFMIFSRIFDVYLSSFHIPGLSERAILVVILVSGSFWRPFQTNIGTKLLWFTGWMVVGVPFSYWKGGSFSLLTTQWWPCMIVFVAVGGLITDFQQYRRAAMTMALGIFVLSILCLETGSMESGRLFMSHGRFGNPNEMAQAMLIGIPFWLAISKRSSSPIVKIIAGCVLLLMSYVIAKTGSRGALISFAVLYLVLLYHATAIGKAGLLLSGSLLLCVTIAFLPSALKDRYRTIFSEDKPEVEEAGEEGLLRSAVDSTESREHLFRQSLILTATHPIFGVGVGQFSVAENALAISQGRKKGTWLGTHNSYMQVASETGLPGLLFFVWILFLSLKATHSLYTRTKDHLELREISTQAEALFLSSICLAITDISIHAAYTMLLPVLAGMTISLVQVSKPLIAKVKCREATVMMPAAPLNRMLPRRVSPASTAI